MAVRIRLRRLGGKRDSFYRIVVADSRQPRDGRAIEELGFYDPVEQPTKAKVNVERADYWLQQGAKPSETVRDLFRRAGILDGGTDGSSEKELDIELVQADQPEEAAQPSEGE